MNMIVTDTGVMLADPREVWLARAAARDRLVQAGEMDLEEALAGLLPAFERLRPCTCAREIIDRLSRPLPRQRRRVAA